MIKTPADGSPVDDPAKLSATSSATSRRVCSPVGTDLGFFHLLILFLFRCFVNAFSRIINDGCGPKYKGYFYVPSLFSAPNRKTTAELLANWNHHHQERIHIYTYMYHHGIIGIFVVYSSLKLFWMIPSSLLSSAAWPILLSTGWNTRTLVSHRISYLYFIIINQIIAVFKFSAKTLFRHEQFFQQWISNIYQWISMRLWSLCFSPLMICNRHAVWCEVGEPDFCHPCSRITCILIPLLSFRKYRIKWVGKSDLYQHDGITCSSWYYQITFNIALAL